MRWSVTVICSLQKHSPYLAQHPGHLRPQRFGSGISRNLSDPKTLGNGPSRLSPAGASIAYPGCPLVTNHERKRTRSWRLCKNYWMGRSTASPLAGVRFRLQQRGLTVITNAASRAALKGSADCPSKVATARIEQYSNVRSALPILPPSRHLVGAPCHSTNISDDLSSPLSLETLCPDPHAQHGGGEGHSNRRMVISGAFSPVRENPC